MKRRFSADVMDIMTKSGEIGERYAVYIEECLARGDEVIAEKYGSDLARFLKNALQEFRISSVEYDRAMEELELLGVVHDIEEEDE